MGIICIHTPSLKTDNERVMLSYDVTVKNDKGNSKRETLWFSISEKYKEYISDEVCDGVVLIMLFYALRGGYNIDSEVPISSRLYYTLTHQFIPQMVLMNPSAYHVELKMNTCVMNWNPNAVATAMSCGIDSLTTYYEYTDDKIPRDLQITHLTFFEQGAHHGGGGRSWEEQDRIYMAQLETAKHFCKEVGKDLIDIRSNLDDFLNRLLWHEYYEHTHTYKNIGIVLLLQKLIKVYYYSATYNLDCFSCSLEDDSAHYEKWMLPNSSTEQTSFFSSNSSRTRIEKIKYLSERPETYGHILVCYREGKNCGICMKCWRTMLEMEVSGVLDLYSTSFNIEEFRNNYENYISEMISRKNRESLMNQIYWYMKNQKLLIPLKCEIRGRIRRIHRWVLQICAKNNS